MEHPRLLSDITPAWMTEALRAGGVLRQAVVTQADVTPIGTGMGFLSGRGRVRLSYDQTEAGAPASVVVKLPAQAEDSRTIGESTHAYEREIRFYREVAPMAGVRVPRMYYTEMDPVAGVYIIVMEDLTGLQIGDQVAGLTRAQVVAAADTIVPLHARWWGGAQRGQLPWVPSVEEEMQELFVSAAHYRSVWPDFLREFGAHLPPGGVEVGERVGRNFERILAAYETGPRTLTHFDYRADNLILDDLTRPQPIIVLDWQLMMWGKGVFDLARLVCGSLPPAERGGHHDEILNRWHRGLVACGVTGYSIDEAWRDYRLSAIAAMLNPVLFHHMFKLGGERGLALGAVMTERTFSAVLECGATEVMGP